MKHDLEQAVAAAIQRLYQLDQAVELTRPEEKFGDYATNVALQLAKQLGRPPRELAAELSTALQGSLSEQVSEVSVAGPGFINLRLSDGALLAAASATITGLRTGQRILLEYSCPNAFKELHTGHLYQTIVGDAIGRMYSASGATVFRANFGGDVGLHVAKSLYGIIETLGGDLPEKLQAVPEADRPSWITAAYVRGAAAYQSQATTKAEIDELNKKIYEMHASDDHQSPLAIIYWTCRQWSYDYFNAFYDLIQVAPFDAYYPESTTIQPGIQLVRANTGTIFKESDGAVVYEGDESKGLHTRVFITSQGLPTYEAKDLGVIFAEVGDFAYDSRLIMTGNEQIIYMKVIFAALAAIDTALAAKQVHRSNGTVKFSDGQKMSSRLGNVTRAVDVVTTVNQAVAQANPGTDHRTTSLAAIKYSFLKHRLGSDIAFDIHESIALEGNSGPYLQYAHARARSILAKATLATQATLATPAGTSGQPSKLEPGERSLVRKLSEYADIVSRSLDEFMPHYLCTYLYELAQTFNIFYEHNRVIGDPRQSGRLALVEHYAVTLKSGLELLGITAPETM